MTEIYSIAKKQNNKRCAVCGMTIYKRTGIHYYGRLIHKKCKGLMKNYHWRFKQ